MLTRRHWTILFTLKLLKMGLVALLLLQSRASAETLGDIGLRAEEIQRLTVALRGLRAELEAGEPRTAEAVLGELNDLVEEHRLSGAQTVWLLAFAVEQLGEPWPQPPVQRLAQILADHRVPGPELMGQLLPGLRRRIQRQGPDFSAIRRARQFAERYQLPQDELQECLRQLRRKPS